MRRIRLSATDLDGWLWYNRIEKMTPDDLIARLRKECRENDRMKIGSAWHSVLENPPDSEVIKLVYNGGYTFSIDCEAIIQLPQIREIKLTKDIVVNDILVTLVGKADAVDGNTIADHKLTFRPNPEAYFDAYQWKVYLSIFNADRFYYHIFSAKNGKENCNIIINDYSSMVLYRYPEMEDDIYSGLSELLEFIEKNAPDLILS